MNPWLLTAALLYLLVAAAHSWLGECKVLRPLLRERWQIGLPRGFTEVLLRLAWHVTSFAWIAAAAILGGAACGGAVPAFVVDALGVLALVTGGVMLVGLRGAHPAWAVFSVIGFASLVGAHGWPSSAGVRGVTGAIAALVLAGLGALHVYWAAGGRRGTAAAVPTRADGSALLRPSHVATIAVAVALFGAAAVIASAAGLAPRVPWVHALGLAAAATFGLRMIGDFRVVGLFKRERRTPFARWDSMLFSPLCGALCAACAVAAS